MQDNFLKSYRARLVREGLVSSLAFGVMIGAGAELLTAFLCYLFALRGIWLPLTVGGGVLVLSAVLLYFLRFRPTERDVVRRVDSMGLEERTVTMYDFAAEDTYIAKRQREDAVARIEAVDRASVRSAFPVFAVKTWAVILTVVLCLSGAGMTTVAALADAGVIPSPDILPNRDKELFYLATYLTEGEGEIEGEPEQTVAAGEDASAVVAVAEDGWMFVKWSDGIKTPARQDLALTEDLSVTAIFEELGEGGTGGDGDDAFDAEEGDADKEAPSDQETDSSTVGGGDDGQGGEGSGQGDKGDGTGTGEGGQEGDGKGDGKGDGAGGGWSDGNQIIDGKTDYRDVRDLYYDQAMEILRNGGELPDYLRDFIEQYYGSI